MAWYVRRKGLEQGPFSTSELKDALDEGRLGPSDLIRPAFGHEWAELSSYSVLREDLRRIRSQPRRPRPSHASRRAAPPPSRGRAIAAALVPAYLRAHWGGELPLTLSYWVNGLLLTAGFGAALKLAAELFGPRHPTVIFSWAMAALLATGILALWQNVGIWRSAGRHLSRGGLPFWAWAARAMVLLSLAGTLGFLVRSGLPQLTELGRIAFEGDPLGRYELQVLGNGTELEMLGPVTYGLADDVRKLLDANPGIRTLRMNSDGGRVGQARELRTLIRERHLATLSTTGCHSACTLAFLGGAPRWLAPGARLGFHQYSAPGRTSADMREAYVADRADMVDHGITPEFAAVAFQAPPTDMWFPSVATLRQGGVISGVTRRGQFADEDTPALAAVEERVLKLGALPPPLAMLKQRDTAAYREALTGLRRAGLGARSDEDVALLLQQASSGAAMRHIPTAADAAAIAYTRVLVEQLRILGRQDARLCQRLLSGGMVEDHKAIAAALPRRLLDDENAALRRVVQTSLEQARRPPARAGVQASLGHVLGELRRSQGEDAELLNSPSRPGIDARRTCRVFTEFYDKALVLPSADAGPLLRWLFIERP